MDLVADHAKPDAPAPASPALPAAQCGRGIAATACALLIVVMGVLSWLAVRGKAPTADEPLHTLGAWVAIHQEDYRVNFEDPSLWHRLVTLFNGPDALHVSFDTPSRRPIVGDHPHRAWLVVDLMYRTAGNDADRAINRSRLAMLAAAIGLGLLLARWSWQVGGPAAAVTATVLYALNPMILGHAPLVKNDISMALVLLAVAYCVWRMGRRLHVAEALALGLLCGIAATTKYSGVIAGPIAAGLLGLRAMLPQAWTIFGRQVGRRWARLLIVGVLAIGSAALTWAVIWTVYGFRYAPTPDGTVAFDPQPLVTKGLMKRFLAERGPADATLEEAMQLRPEDVADQSPGAVTRALLWTYDRRLLPQAWLYGLLFTHQSAVVRQNYLFGEYSLRGWWYYFPVAMLAKTPLATLAAAATAAGIALLARRRTATAGGGGGGGGGRAGGGGGGVWLAACLAVPPGVYMLLAMASSLNIGLRHVLPVFPFAFLGIGVAASWFWARSRRLAGGLGIVLALGLAAETLAAYPNYIAFFNAASGGPRGGLQLLGDSNLDWGQDLKLLAEWHRRHPERELYASFFTSVDPAAYGLSDYRNTLMADAYGAPMAQVQPGPGRVLAISATNLQASYAPDRALREAMRQIREQLEPIEVLGGTVYLYDLDTPRAHRLFGSPP